MMPSVKRILADRRAAALLGAAYAEETARGLPEYLALEREIRALAYEQAIAPDDDKERRGRRLAAERDALLAARGLSLAPAFVCPRCGDTGYLEGRVCDCARELEREQLRARLGCAPERARFEDADFAVFGDGAAPIRKLYAKLRSFAEKFDTTPVCNILLTGSVGSGKTRLASCVYAAVLERGRSALWTTAFSLGNLCLSVHTSFDQKNSLATVLETDLLVIDDLGTEPVYRNVTLEYFYSVLNDRLQQRKKTLVTTNLSPDQLLARYGERIFSRLSDKSLGVTLPMNGKDLRLGKEGS